MESLRIGIILNNNLLPSAGGGFSYHNRLLSGIDKYRFDKRLTFLFIYIGFNKQIDSVKSNITFINPFAGFGLKGNLLRLLRKVCDVPLLRQLFLKKVLNAFQRIYNRKIESLLIENNVHLLYDLTPFAHRYAIPYIQTHWDIGHLSSFPFPEMSMNQTFEHRENSLSSLKKAFAIFCESNAGKEELLSYVGINPARVFIVPLFAGEVVEVNVDYETETAVLENYRLAKNKFFFYPAQFWSHKNHSTLLFAFKKALELYPNIKLVFTGSDKGNLPYVKRLIKHLEIEQSLIIPGFVSLKEIHCLYKNAIAAVIPTFLGPTNMPLLEAAELGCPVICSDFKGHRELLSDKGYFINPMDEDSIYNSLIKAINTQSDRRPIHSCTFTLANALKSVEDNFLKILPIRKTFENNFNQF